jgi:hypothetical protein
MYLCTISYQRKLLLLWAVSCIETTDGLFKLCGWDPLSTAFHNEIVNDKPPNLDTASSSTTSTDIPRGGTPKLGKTRHKKSDRNRIDPQCVEVIEWC